MEVGMALDAHLEGLASKHHELEKQIEAELTHAARDELRLVALKREKLRIKDQIERLRMRQSTAA